MTREGARQPGAETRSVEKVEKVEKLIACNGQVLWSCYLADFHRKTQGTFSTLLVPFRNVISERRTLQNKSGENYRQLVVKKSGESGESGEIEKWRNFLAKVEKFIYRILCIC